MGYPTVTLQYKLHTLLYYVYLLALTIEQEVAYYNLFLKL